MNDGLDLTKFKKTCDKLEYLTISECQQLIAEVERLRIGSNVNHDIYKSQKDKIESLTKELDELKNWGLRQEFDERGTKIKKLEADLKLQEQDNERIIQSSKGTVDRMKAENAERKRNRTDVWAVQDLLAQSDKRYSELMEVKNKFANQLKNSEKARLEAEGKVKTLFRAIRHGDSKHQTWLEEAILEHFK